MAREEQKGDDDTPALAFGNISLWHLLQAENHGPLGMAGGNCTNYNTYPKTVLALLSYMTNNIYAMVIFTFK